MGSELASLRLWEKDELAAKVVALESEIDRLLALIQPTPAETEFERDRFLQDDSGLPSRVSPPIGDGDGEGDLVARLRSAHANLLEDHEHSWWIENFTDAADAIEALRTERDAASVMLASRDAFIVSRGLWSEFVASLPNQRHAVKSELVARAERAEAQVSTLSRQLEEAREAERKRAIAAIHWVFSADGTKSERSMADEAINKINDPDFAPAVPRRP